MVHSCYGSGCPFERWDGECRYHGNVKKCPIDMTEEEAEDAAAEEDYWRTFRDEIKAEDARERYS